MPNWLETLWQIHDAERKEGGGSDARQVQDCHQ
jgi:hypothetical protein